ncbi:tRNA glutamyl-Q(34) synthetase GluQRS [Phyllobacterium sp. 21LDTY02-6]|uniref:tRNA glutamyl-Q(34) synthetase GluQRS n=1 Tax=Phyllobacterium sp. 21LDTY02-6 TaxID=2944903 RepID=UPI00201FCB76|nr:tRNA glutamyl-Q(34) synthetase GluQRS [Phyllobacterium sp. 21LDTY02-6]MCO4317781.1 tRNA glutamyl-Q(34) synthetase GluQRS [Phyllobacterium sp. 21LDTY02-6]
MTKPVFRFAPSPNGHLHPGHAYSALLNRKFADDHDGRLLLRIEDIDRERCTPALERDLLDDLAWIGFEWDGTFRRQSEHFADYSAALGRLVELDLVYPAFMSRSELRQRVGTGDWPKDPDGAPLYPHDEREISRRERQERTTAGMPFAWRLNMDKAVAHIGAALAWDEFGPEGVRQVAAKPEAWGDVVVARRDTPTSYHLAVVVDDALQGITHVVRGRDLFFATAVHRVLQQILGLPAPVYHHHELILDASGEKLSKSRRDTSLRSLRQAGKTPDDIRRMVNL